MRLAFALICAIAMNSASTRAATHEPPIGHVITVEGRWVDQLCRCKVEVGHAIWNETKIVRQTSSAPVSRLTVRLAATGIAEAFDCGTNTDCARPLDVLARVPKNEPPNQIATFLRAALSVLAENLPSTRGRTISGYARTLSRGPQGASLTDAIVPLRNGKVNLSAAFAGATAGIYLVEFCPVGRMGASSCPDVPVSTDFHWRGDGEEALSSQELQPGVYELFICRRQGQRVFRGESAFLLTAVDEQTARVMRGRYQQFVHLMDRWNDAEASMLRHAYMRYLSDGG